MPIDPSIVSGLAPAAANLSQMGTFAQQQTAMEARRKREDEQRKQQQIQSILQTSPDDETAVQRLNALDIELGSKYRTQLDDHRKKVGDALKLDLDNDQAQTKLLTAVAQGITDSSTLETGRKLFSTFGDEGAKLASMLPAQWDDAQSPVQMKQFVEMGLSAADFTKKQQEALDRALKGDWDHGLAEMLATADTPEEAQGALEGFKAMRAPKLTLDRFAPLVANWSPDAKKKAGEMALTEQQRQTLAGQAATREQAATRAAETDARLAGSAAEQARHNRVMERRPVGGGASGGAGGSAGGLTPDSVDYVATQYRILGNAGIPTRLDTTQKTAIINAAAAQTKALGMSPAQATQKQSAYKADAASLTQMQKMQSSAEAYEVKASQQADIIKELSPKVGRTSSPMLNGWLLAGKKEVAGDTDTALLFNAIQTFASEYAKIMEGSTGSVAASSDSARKASENLIKASMSPKTMDAAVSLMQREMDLTMNGYDVTIKHITERMGGASGAAEVPPQVLAAGPGRHTFKNGQTWEVSADGKSARKIN